QKRLTCARLLVVDAVTVMLEPAHFVTPLVGRARSITAFGSAALERLPLRVVRRPGPIDRYDGVVSDNPGIVTGRDQDELAGPCLGFFSVGHLDHHATGHLVEEMRRLTEIRACDRLDVVRPLPARLRVEPADRAATDIHDLDVAMTKLPHLVRGTQGLVFHV